MITRTVRVQLAIFVIGTLVALAYVGTRYAQIDRVFRNADTVTVSMAESGGIFTTADVTYRGVSVGRVSDMWLDGSGVRVEVTFAPGAPPIPADTDVVVANRSAVGEQFLDFQPRRDSGPYLTDGARIASNRVQVPVDTRTLLTNVTAMLGSVNSDDLRTVIDELGTAFDGSGEDIATILSSSNSFLTTADQEFDVTADLIRSSGTVLQTQADSADHIRDFASNLRRLSTSVRSSDGDLRTVIDSGAPTATTLRQVLAENSDDIAKLLDQSITVNGVVKANLGGVRQVLVIAPYGVESAFSIIAKDSRTGQYAARLSLVMDGSATPCLTGYAPGSSQRTPYDRTVESWNRQYGCTTPGVRGTKAPQVSSPSAASSGASTQGSAPGADVVVGTYDVATKKLDLGDEASTIPQVPSLGEESWKWMMLGPAVAR